MNYGANCIIKPNHSRTYHTPPVSGFRPPVFRQPARGRVRLLADWRISASLRSAPTVLRFPVSRFLPPVSFPYPLLKRAGYNAKNSPRRQLSQMKREELLRLTIGSFRQPQVSHDLPVNPIRRSQPVLHIFQ